MGGPSQAGRRVRSDPLSGQQRVTGRSSKVHRGSGQTVSYRHVTSRHVTSRRVRAGSNRVIDGVGGTAVPSWGMGMGMGMGMGWM